MKTYKEDNIKNKQDFYHQLKDVIKLISQNMSSKNQIIQYHNSIIEDFMVVFLLIPLLQEWQEVEHLQEIKQLGILQLFLEVYKRNNKKIEI